MQPTPPPRSPNRLVVVDLALEAIHVLRPTVAKIRRCDRDLGEQLRTALSAVALNAAEGGGSSGGTRIQRFSTALGSADESRTTLRAAVAWGYIEMSEIEEGDRLLDRVAGGLYRLGARRH
jgi:four helix bundle protein